MTKKLKSLQKEVHEIAKKGDGWKKHTKPLERIALIHTELSEATQAIRAGQSREHLGLQFADVVIRLMDLCESMNIDLSACINRKTDENKQRVNGHESVKPLPISRTKVVGYADYD